MKTRKAFAVFIALIAGVFSSLLLLVYLTSATPISDVTLDDLGQLDTSVPEAASSTEPYSVTFPAGEWPWYAQEEISVHPESPVAGEPTEICAEVVNTDPLEPHPAILEFWVADFGIGMPTNPVGAVEVLVPPQGAAQGCTVWIPPDSAPKGFEVVLHQEGFAPQRSQRFVDSDEPLMPGVPHDLEFPVGNPTEHLANITLGLIPHLPGWGYELS